MVIEIFCPQILGFGCMMRRKVDELDEFCGRLPERCEDASVHRAQIDMGEMHSQLVEITGLQLRSDTSDNQTTADPQLRSFPRVAIRYKSWPRTAPLCIGAVRVRSYTGFTFM
jgi:hypothetical protein